MSHDCPHLDETLSTFLDGMPKTSSQPDLHHQECPRCLDALRRSRRLDALVAKTSDLTVDDQSADRLFAEALPTKMAPATRPAKYALPTAAATLVLGVGLGFWLADQAQDPPTPGGQAQDTQTPTAFDPIELPTLRPATARARSSSWSRRRLHRSPNQIELIQEPGFEAGVAVSAAIATGLQLLANPLSGRLPTIAGFQRRAQDLAHQARLSVGLRLLASGREADRRDLLRYLATSAPHQPGAELLEAARQSSDFTRWLERRLRSQGADRLSLTAAVRLGTPRLDANVEQLVRRDPALTSTVVESLHRTSPRPASARLLLDLWATLQARSDDDLATARGWFQGLPDDATQELISLARATRNQPERLRCLRALAWRSDIEAMAYTTELLNGNHHENALAAGFVMSRMPSAAVESTLYASLTTSRRPYIVLAALFGMRSRLTSGYYDTTALTREESDFLRTGRFTASQFSIAARLCKRRQLLSD